MSLLTLVLWKVLKHMVVPEGIWPLPSTTAATESLLRGIRFQHPATWGSPSHQTMPQSLACTEPACSVTHLLACFSPGVCPAGQKLQGRAWLPTSLGPLTSTFCRSGILCIYSWCTFFPSLIFQNSHFNLGFYLDMMKFQACSQLHPRFQGALVLKIPLHLRKWYWSEQCWRVGGPRLTMGKMLEFQTLNPIDSSSFWSFQHLSGELNLYNLEGRELIGSGFIMTYLCHLINKKSGSQLKDILTVSTVPKPRQLFGF